MPCNYLLSCAISATLASVPLTTSPVSFYLLRLSVPGPPPPFPYRLRYAFPFPYPSCSSPSSASTPFYSHRFIFALSFQDDIEVATIRMEDMGFEREKVPPSPPPPPGRDCALCTLWCMCSPVCVCARVRACEGVPGARGLRRRHPGGRLSPRQALTVTTPPNFKRCSARKRPHEGLYMQWKHLHEPEGTLPESLCLFPLTAGLLLLPRTKLCSPTQFTCLYFRLWN
jgi:hypothetical protein